LLIIISENGRIIVAGTPEQVAKNAASYTGQFLKSELGM
jgi:excinuclease UvrABC ATPase subunit